MFVFHFRLGGSGITGGSGAAGLGSFGGSAAAGGAGGGGTTGLTGFSIPFTGFAVDIGALATVSIVLASETGLSLNLTDFVVGLAAAGVGGLAGGTGFDIIAGILPGAFAAARIDSMPDRAFNLLSVGSCDKSKRSYKSERTTRNANTPIRTTLGNREDT
jgi:hypothetical protein